MKYHFKNRPNREITNQEEILRLLKNGKYATLSLCKNNEPYIVTLSYGYDEQTNSLYFHCAKEGLKLDFIEVNPRVCATIIEDGGYIANECGHLYKTLVFWGSIEILSDFDKKKEAIKILLNHLETDTEIKSEKLKSSFSLYENMVVLKLTITELHGKAGR
ncbi:MAG: pyridoxamine 5'-phosphate oxidase family protein [Bacteroidetes bacterium]|nr:pyridoxamine 5'-phosphate oxidase family protein [Bacteroidota bacterium]